MPDTWQATKTFLDSFSVNNCSQLEADYLYQLSLGTKGIGEIVEVGTNVGKSTIALSFAQKEKGGRPINSVDIFQHPDIIGNLQTAGVTDYVICHVGSSSHVSRQWHQPIELLWLDGDHCQHGTATDIKCWSKHVTIGGKIALHDYPGHMGSNEIARAVQKLLFAQPRHWRLVADREAHSIIVFEKLDPAHTPPKLKGWAYWCGRNLRSMVFTHFPRLSKTIVAKLKS